jgi:hypothetical protein
MRKREVLIKQRGLSIVAAETQIFGMPLEQLALKLAQHWRLPIATQKALSPQFHPSKRQLVVLSKENSQHSIEDDTHLRVLIQQPEYCVYLSNWLSLSADNHWYSAATLRILNVVAQYSSMSLIDCINHVHQVAVRLSHEHPIPEVAMPAAKLIYPAILKTQDEHQETLATTKPQTNSQDPLNSPQIKAKQKPVSGNVQKDMPSQSNNEVDPPRLADKVKLTTALKQLTQQPEIFTDLHHLMHCCNDAIIDGLCLKRSLVLIANSEQSYMRVYYQKGVAQSNPLANYHIDLHRPGLIKKLMSKKSGFQITPANYNSICSILPEDFSTTVASQDLFLMSLFSGDRAVGMVMADAKGHVAPLTTGEYGTFKKLCQGVCHTLEDMSSRGGRKT